MKINHFLMNCLLFNFLCVGTYDTYTISRYNTSSNFERYLGDYVKLYVETIKPIVTGIDDTRPYFISSPSSNIGNYTSHPGSPFYGDGI